METNIEFSPIVREGERIDEIGFGGYKLIQKPEEFCYGVDSVLLSDFAASRMKEGADLVIDLGSRDSGKFSRKGRKKRPAKRCIRSSFFYTG